MLISRGSTRLSAATNSCMPDAFHPVAKGLVLSGVSVLGFAWLVGCASLVPGNNKGELLLSWLFTHSKTMPESVIIDAKQEKRRLGGL